MSTATKKLQKQPRIDPTRIDPEATYSDVALAAALSITPRTLRRWRDDEVMKFPRPFKLGGRPHWRGRVIVNWFDRMQDEQQAGVV